MTVKTPKLYDVCDVATEAIIYFMMIFSPWAFGTTEPWSIWTMNIAGYVLGLLLLIKWITCRVTGHTPHRWKSDATLRWRRFQRISARGLAGITIFLLAYVLCQAVNARADYLWGYGRFEWFDEYIKWLPHSYDQGATWQALFKWSALACVFWSVRDWFTVKSIHERRKFRKDENRERVQPLLNRKLTRFIWVLSINAGLLALVGILQRFSGTDKLLWLVQPPINKLNIQQFGPWAYRGMAAAWFNMVWPLTIGLVLTKVLGGEKQQGRRIDDAFFVLIPLVMLLMVSPAVSSSRLGLLVSGLLVLGFSARFGGIVFRRAGNYRFPLGIGLVLIAATFAWTVYGQLIERVSRSSFPPQQTGIETANSGTFVVHLKMPARLHGEWVPVFALSASDQIRRSGGYFEAILDQTGDLVFISSTGMVDNRKIWRRQGFADDYAGRAIEMNVVISNGSSPQLSVDGMELSLQMSGGTAGAQVQRISSAFLWSGIGKSSVWRGGPVQTVVTHLEAHDGRQASTLAELGAPPVMAMASASGREQIYRLAIRIMRDYPGYGVGLGAFPALSQLYREETLGIWHAYVHNDCLEMAVSVGLVGAGAGIIAGIILVMLGVTLARVSVFSFGLAMSFLAIVLHSSLDFPAQNYSTAFLVVLVPSLVWSTLQISHKSSADIKAQRSLLPL